MSLAVSDGVAHKLDHSPTQGKVPAEPTLKKGAASEASGGFSRGRHSRREQIPRTLRVLPPFFKVGFLMSTKHRRNIPGSMPMRQD
jgi:hypothetical protein